MTVDGFYSVVALELIQYSNNHIEGDDWILMQEKNYCKKTKQIVKQGFLPLAMCESMMVRVLSEASLFCPTENGAVE